MRQAAQLYRDVEREAKEAYERDIAENKEAYDALDHHRDVYLRDTRESDNALNGYITNARKQDFYNYRLHFDPDQGYLLLADSDREDDLIIRNFTMVGSQIVLHGVQEMGFEVGSVEPAFTYEIYQLKSGEEHHYHRFESMKSNKYAHLTQDDYDPRMDDHLLLLLRKGEKENGCVLYYGIGHAANAFILPTVR